MMGGRRLRPRLLVGLMAGGIFLALAGVLGGIIWRQPRFAVEKMAAWNPEVLFRVETTAPVVALTIDDGPHADITPRVLDVLARHGARATFFVLGENIGGNEDLLARMRAEGHEIANHLVEDRPSILLGEEEFARQLHEVDPWLDRQARWRWLRPGSGWFSPGMVEIAARHGYGLCLGSIFPHDDRIHDAERLAATVLGRVRPGDVIILHDGAEERAVLVDVLERILPELAARGFRVTTVSDLVEVGEQADAERQNASPRER
jgi:peptidoglycan/xylan/chitin deacetylase (PgdA/CDA1 family)